MLDREASFKLFMTLLEFLVDENLDKSMVKRLDGHLPFWDRRMEMVF